jgi:hypothetical protein
MFDFKEISHEISSDELVLTGILPDEEGDITIIYKVIVCSDQALTLRISTYSDEYDDVKETFDAVLNSFMCIE